MKRGQYYQPYRNKRLQRNTIKNYANKVGNLNGMDKIPEKDTRSRKSRNNRKPEQTQQEAELAVKTTLINKSSKLNDFIGKF